MATTPSGIVVRVRSSRSFRYPTFPGVSWIRVHRIAAAASSLKRKVSAPRAARSWFPRPRGGEGYITCSIRGEEEMTIRTPGGREPRHLGAVTLPDRLPMESEEVLRPKPLDPGRPVLRAKETVLHHPGARRTGDHR